MASNFVQPGDTLELIAPVGGVTSGEGCVIGALFVVALNSAGAGEQFRGSVVGVWSLPKAASVTPSAGSVAYWDDTAKTVTGTSGSGLFPIGVFVAQPGANDATAVVRLNGTTTEAVS